MAFGVHHVTSVSVHPRAVLTDKTGGEMGRRTKALFSRILWVGNFAIALLNAEIKL